MSALTAQTLRAFLSCPRQAYFLVHPPAEAPVPLGDFDQSIMSAGQQFEAAELERLKQSGIEITRVAPSPGDPAKAAAETRQLINAKVPAIYQGVFHDPATGDVGIPDLILRNPTLKISDIKIAKSFRGQAEYVMQLAFYRDLWKRTIGIFTPQVELRLQSGPVQVLDPDINKVSYPDVRDRTRRVLAESEPPQAQYSHSTCSVCEFRNTCVPAFEAAHDVSMVPGIQRRVAVELKTRGIQTWDDLAKCKPTAVKKVPNVRDISKARAQAQALAKNRPIVRDKIGLPSGVPLLFLDLENDPMDELFTEMPAIYLWGMIYVPAGTVPGDPTTVREDPYDDLPIFSTSADPGGYRAAWEETVLEIDRRLAAEPNLRIVHYAPIERTRVNQCAEYYGAPAGFVERFEAAAIDLCHEAKRISFLPVYSYGLKAVEQIAGFKRSQVEYGSLWSAARYREWVDDQNSASREAVILYNKEDNLAAWAVWRFLVNLTAVPSDTNTKHDT